MSSHGKSSFLGRLGTPEDIDRMISSDDVDGVRSAMNRNPAWTKEHTEACLKSEHPSMRLMPARFQWKQLSDEQRSTLLNDPHPEVSKRALRSRFNNMSGDELVKYISDPANKVHHVMAYEAGIDHDNFDDHHIKQLLDHPDIRIRKHADQELYHRENL